MSTCKTCGKPIRKGLSFCSEACREKAKNEHYQHIYETQPKSTPITQDNKLFLSQWDKGHGSARRETNIRRVVEMFERGVSEDDIRYELLMLFRPTTVDDYISMAKETLRRKGG